MTQFSLSLNTWFESVDNMHFQVHKLAVDRVLRWSVEVVLKSVQIAALDVLLE